MDKYAFLIPYYNHPERIFQLCEELKKHNVHILIVNDGSNKNARDVLDTIENVEILDLEQNGGKGYALKKGFLHLLKNGFTHALQIDADFQHDINDIETFFSTSKKYPKDLICGLPIYDENAPKSRLYGRKITNFWIYINTKGKILKDGMCGFRLYPLLELKNAFKNTKSNKMDFDTEILVQAFYDGVNFKWINTKIKYNNDNSSHFRLFKDNVLISYMHFRMFLLMLKNLFKGI